ncbi:hypothetical protein C1H46_042605 [Malus baccata]|uniref:Uncharacterized protein n=1 Tax=Malus baccata TaxID=106549 RepID=A0A540KCC3_MALBA|nr:hypothetical protein C1H46_042605 [Malus baccata]
MAERVNLAYTLEELLNFTLQSFVNGTLELDLGLPKDFCSQLLQPEPEPNDDLFPPSLSDTTGVQVYRKFYTEEKEMSNGVLAISVSKLPLQPCDLLAGMLFGLNKGGLQGLLGLAHTTGTIPEALPPPKSTLLSSFMMPYKLNVRH